MAGGGGAKFLEKVATQVVRSAPKTATPPPPQPPIKKAHHQGRPIYKAWVQFKGLGVGTQGNIGYTLAAQGGRARGEVPNS
jgi:hypothetical protein